MTLADIDTGRTIGAAPSTAAFVRDQLARGVSAETLRRRLKIRPEHMLGLVARAGCAMPEYGEPGERPGPKPPAPPIAPEPEPASSITRGAILRAVCDAWEIEPARVLQPGKQSQRIARPRQALYMLLKRRLNLSFWGVARVMGLSSHCSVARGINRAVGLYEHDPDWRRRFDRAEAALKASANG